MNALNLISFKSQTHKQLKCITLMRAVSSSNIILYSKTASVVTFLSLSSHLFNTVPDYFVKDFILWNTYWGYIAVILQDDLWIHTLIHTLLEICSIFCNCTKKYIWNSLYTTLSMDILPSMTSQYWLDDITPNLHWLLLYLIYKSSVTNLILEL